MKKFRKKSRPKFRPLQTAVQKKRINRFRTGIHTVDKPHFVKVEKSKKELLEASPFKGMKVPVLVNGVTCFVAASEESILRHAIENAYPSYESYTVNGTDTVVIDLG